jgi:hypothetical protein
MDLIRERYAEYMLALRRWRREKQQPVSCTDAARAHSQVVAAAHRLAAAVDRDYYGAAADSGRAAEWARVLSTARGR